MKTIVSAGKAGNRVQTHFVVAETGSSVPEEESGIYQPTKKDLRVLFGLLLAGAGMTLFALYGVWCAVEKVMRGLGL